MRRFEFGGLSAAACRMVAAVVLAAVGAQPAIAQTTVRVEIGFDDLGPYVADIGQDLMAQYAASGVVFSKAEGDTLLRGFLMGVEPAVAVDSSHFPFPPDPVATATFVDPTSGVPTTVAELAVSIWDDEATVAIETFDADGLVIHSCGNVFSGCAFALPGSGGGMDLLFPGGGIAGVRFIDTSFIGLAGDGHVFDDLAFDLTIEDEGSGDPESKGDCKKGGWEAFGFRNQGQCVRFVQTGKDSRS